MRHLAYHISDWAPHSQWAGCKHRSASLLETMPTWRGHRSGKLNCCSLVALALALGCLMPGSLLANADLAEPALLDSLVAYDPSPPWESQSVDISRRVLPDVPATKLPRTTAPHRPPRLANPMNGAYQFHLAQKALVGGNLDLAAQKIRTAARTDPATASYRYWQSVLTFKRFDPNTLVEALPAAIRTSATDFASRQRLLLLVHQAAVLFLALLWSLLALAYLLSFWRHLGHDLGALFFRSPRHRLRPWLVMLPLLALILLRPGWLVLLSLLSIPLLVHARGRQRLPLVVVWLAATALLFPRWAPLNEALPALDPASETNLLVQATHSSPASHLITDLQARLEQSPEPDRRSRLQLALAIQLARRGDYAGSSDLLSEILATNPQHVAASVNLANNTYYLGGLDAAAEDYLAAQKLDPGNGAISYNLAQVYFKKLFLPEAGEALKQARADGFTAAPWEDPTGEANGFSPVVYLGHSTEELATGASAEAGNYPAQAHLAAWQYWLGSPPLPLFSVLACSFLLALAIVFWRSREPKHRHCLNCGWVICPTCGRIRDGAWLCTTCTETADRAKSDLVMATLLKNRSRSQELRRLARRSLMGRLLPGSGHLAAGHVAAGTIRLIMLAGALYLLLFGWSFDLSARWETPGLILTEECLQPVWFPLPRAAWPGLTGGPILAGLILTFFVYLLAQLDGTALRHPDRNRFPLGEFTRETGLLGSAGSTASPAPSAYRRPS